MAELPVKDGEQLTREQMREQDQQEEAFQTARNIALQILTLTRNGLFVSLRFMDVALCQFVYVSADQVDLPFDIKKVATTGEHLIFDPRYIIQQYMREKKSLSRDYLHMVLHCIFRHPFVSTHMNREYWDLAADIAAEATVCELGLNQTDVQNASEIEYEIERIKGFVTQMNAERIYRFLLQEEVPARDINKWTKLFRRDEHDIWWEAARRIEEEKKQEAEKEAGQDDDTGEEPDYQEEENKENSEEEQEENPDAEDSDETSDEESEDQDEDESQDEGEQPEDGGEENESGEDESDEDQSGESDEEQDQSGEDEEEDEDSEEPPYDEYEDEYVSSPGGENENSDEQSQGDPESETHDSEEESSGEGEGGGNPGDEPEQTDEEGSERENDTPSEGLNGHDDGHQPENKKNDESGELGGETNEGVPDDSDNPFGDKDQEGNANPDDSSGGMQHSAGSGGGGEGKQAAWQHEGGSERRSDGERDENDMRRLDGSADPNTDQKDLKGDNSRQEAMPEQGTADSGEEPPEDKQPSFMHNGREQEELENKWKEISERMLVDLETSSKEWGDKSDAMVQNLRKINRDKYDYRTFLQKFASLHEDIQINDDEFDYIYYTYGLKHYGDIPLIEPLEYKEVKKVRDFVIAIDTSGSCAGEVVQKFLDKTYSIFSQQENFFRKINLHIIQCDAAIQSDVKITNKEEFADYMKNLEFRGFGGTDFRPVFEYVNQLLEHNEFDDLKGLIYFTDGNGVYPKKRPPYETAFVFVDDDEFDYEVPSWAMKLVLETSEITEEVLI
ncbi:MAG: VWA-like domain-containing protein [Anaerovoracaceae bacterium]|jgi:predicted metal-dependent peptidase